MIAACNLVARRENDARRGKSTSARAAAFVVRTCPCKACRSLYAALSPSSVKRRKSEAAAPALARRRRGPAQPQLPGISDHVDAPYCGCDRCWERDA